MLMIALRYSSCFAQGCEAKLKELGFENIDLVLSNDTMYVSVEDPVYRGTFRGAGVVLKNMSLLCPSTRFYNVVVKEDNIDKYAIGAVVENGHWNVDVNYNSSKVNEAIRSHRDKGKAVRNYNSSYGKVNVTFYPIFSFSNNLTYKLFSFGVMIAPAVEASLWKGNRFVFQPIVPLYDNYDGGDSNPVFSHLQFGSVTVQQDFANNAKWWCRAYAGFFHYNNIGLCLNAGLHLNKYFDVGMLASASKWQDMTEGSLNVEGDTRYSTLLTLSYYESISSVEVKLTGGRYMYGDYGGRLDGICHFGEYSIGLYGIYTGGEYNGGFHFSIPVAGKVQRRMGDVSFRIPEFFDWEYSMVSNYDWADKNCGETVEPLPARNRSANYWQARYVQTYLQKYLNGEVE